MHLMYLLYRRVVVFVALVNRTSSMRKSRAYQGQRPNIASTIKHLEDRLEEGILLSTDVLFPTSYSFHHAQKSSAQIAVCALTA